MFLPLPMDDVCGAVARELLGNPKYDGMNPADALHAGLLAVGVPPERVDALSFGIAARYLDQPVREDQP